MHSDRVLFQDVDGETVLLDLASERYFALDPVGTRIWELLGETPSLQQVHEGLCAEFEAEPDQLANDLLVLVAQLATAGLIKVG